MKRMTLITLAVLMWGCAMPVTSTHTLDSRPSISVKNAGERAVLYLDGVRVGPAADFEEPRRLIIEPGTHRVALKEGAKAVLEQTIFVESEHKTINAR